MLYMQSGASPWQAGKEWWPGWQPSHWSPATPERQRHLPRKSQTLGWVPAGLHSHAANEKRHFRGSLCTSSLLLSFLKKRLKSNSLILNQAKTFPSDLLWFVMAFIDCITNNSASGETLTKEQNNRICLTVTAKFSISVGALHLTCRHSVWFIKPILPTIETSPILFKNKMKRIRLGFTSSGGRH